MCSLVFGSVSLFLTLWWKWSFNLNFIKLGQTFAWTGELSGHPCPRSRFMRAVAPDLSFLRMNTGRQQFWLKHPRPCFHLGGFEVSWLEPIWSTSSFRHLGNEPADRSHLSLFHKSLCVSNNILSFYTIFQIIKWSVFFVSTFEFEFRDNFM